MAGYLVIGAGKFGRSIAKTLYRHNETVLVIDKNESVWPMVPAGATLEETFSEEDVKEKEAKAKK